VQALLVVGRNQSLALGRRIGGTADLVALDDVDGGLRPGDGGFAARPDNARPAPGISRSEMRRAGEEAPRTTSLSG